MPITILNIHTIQGDTNESGDKTHEFAKLPQKNVTDNSAAAYSYHGDIFATDSPIKQHR